MKYTYIRIIIAFALLLTGCSVPSRPTLRIAISNSPGSAVLYVAQEAGLYAKYEVDVELVELNSGCECMQALTETNVDAAVVPYAEYVSIPNMGTGILLLIAESAPKERYLVHNHVRNDWQTSQTEMLVGERSELMTRRVDWQHFLLAYEHARMLMNGEPEIQAKRIAERENRASDEVQHDMSRWSFWGLGHQDSLLSYKGPYAALHAHWQGRQFLTAAAASELDKAATRSTNSGQVEKAK
jgi:hypothetical protein